MTSSPMTKDAPANPLTNFGAGKKQLYTAAAVRNAIHTIESATAAAPTPPPSNAAVETAAPPPPPSLTSKANFKKATALEPFHWRPPNGAMVGRPAPQASSMARRGPTSCWAFRR